MADIGSELRPGVLESLRGLTDAELVARVETLASREHVDTALLVAHLAELDTRDVFLRRGYSSLFTYCREALALSEHEAYNRIEVARAARRFPVVLELLACGAVNLTTVRLLAPHLTPENHAAVLESARGKKRSEVEEIVARVAPFPEVPPSIRKLPPMTKAYPPPVPPGPDDASMGSGAASLLPAGSSGAGATASGASAAASPHPRHGCPTAQPYRQPSGEITPLAPDRYRLQCTIAGATLEKLRLAQDMLKHKVPSGDEAAIIDRAFTALLVDLARTKFAAVQNPQPPRGTAPGSRHVPAEVKRAVWVRDLGRCAFVGTDGRRCNERAFIEFHHLKPWAAGGDTTVANIQLRCRRHNRYEARLFFDKRAAAEGGDGVREHGAPYGSERTAEKRTGRLVPERVRMPGPGDSSSNRSPPQGPAVQNRSAARETRPPPRSG